MTTLHALFPGTFDPPTVGHLDVIRRASMLFSRVTVLLAENPTKQALLPRDERARLVEACTSELDGVDVRPWDGLVVDACAELGCQVIVRGLRTGGDFEYEAQLAGTNRVLRPDLDTLFLATSPEHGHVTSTLVRQIAHYGGDTSALVPGPVEEALRARRGG